MAWRNRQNRGNWSSSPNMWKDPASITAKSGGTDRAGSGSDKGCFSVWLPVAIGGFSFVYMVTRLITDWIS